MTKKKFLLKLLLMLTLLLSSRAFAGECLNMRIILNTPLGYINENGQPTGIHWDFLEAIEERAGVCFNQKLTPYARIWKSLEHGEHDGSIVFRSQSRDDLVEYVAPIFTVRTVVMPRKGVQLNNYQDLKKIRIGKVRGTKLSTEFDNDSSLNLVEMKNYQQAWKNIKLGRIEAIAGSEIGLQQSGPEIMLEYADLSSVLVLGERTQWLQLSKKSQHLHNIPRLKVAIESLLSEGVYQVLIKKHEKTVKKQIRR